MSKIRRAQPEDIFDITNILIDEMHSEIGVGEVNKAKVLEYVKYLIEDGVMFIAESNQVRQDGSGLEISGLVAGHRSEWWWSDQPFLSEDFTFVRKEFRKGSTAIKLMKRLNKYAKQKQLPLVTGVFNDVDLERKNKLFAKVYKPFGFFYLGGELNSIGRS